VAAVRDALSIGIVAGMVLVLALGVWTSIPSRRRARERKLQQVLERLREKITAYRRDYGHYPGSLSDLVRRGYLRKVPADPVTGSRASWVEIHSAGCSRARLVDVRSGAAGKASDGTEYRSW